jgi:methylated-DNA-protein-cysteine methyltransferase related protein
MSKFSEKVLQVVDSIPRGKVVSYGQVALYVGIPRSARQVGWILRQSEGKDIPWWRVINNAGRITIKGNRYNTPELQRKLLLSEKVIVTEDFEIDIEEYRFRPGRKELKNFKLDDDYIDIVLEKVPPGE